MSGLLTAVALVGLMLIALNATGFQVNAWVMQLETVSYGLVFLVGLYLLVTELIRLWRRRRTREAAAHDHAHHHHLRTRWFIEERHVGPTSG